ncbi:Synaptosomal-associated protein 47 [Camelus dromedarius]|uniref:Synaptosomal-associated protein 47 n=1 Tax=Camelus dromedarius TaxID=9838 RepID=A0A5N4ED64_CAMDR|nr:Synaptosomal-associated protein 47 [Camelus dromedarius]
MHRFEREDVDDIKVHTPYEVSIRQRFIGKPDIAYRLISAKMPEVIPVLEVQFSKKIELLEDAWMFGSTATASPAEKGYSVWLAASGRTDHAMHSEPSSGSQEDRSLQLQTSELLISDGDAQELRQLLTLVSEPSILPVGGRASCTGFVEGLRPLSSKALAVSVILKKLKDLALDAETELERQDEALDDLTAAVDRTTLTIDKHNRRMKKLT